MAEDYTESQLKTFARWCNARVFDKENDAIEDLSEDLRDGLKLLKLVHRLIKDKSQSSTDESKFIPEFTQPLSRVHRLANVDKALKIIDDDLNIQLNHMNIGAEDVVDGNSTIICGLIWQMILFYEISSIESDRKASSNGRELILQWVDQSIRPFGIKISSENWRNGTIFAALFLHLSVVDEREISTYLSPVQDKGETESRLSAIFEAFSRHLGVPKLLDSRDLAHGSNNVDENSILTFISSLFHNSRGTMVFQERVQRLQQSIDAIMQTINAFSSQIRYFCESDIMHSIKDIIHDLNILLVEADTKLIVAQANYHRLERDLRLERILPAESIRIKSSVAGPLEKAKSIIGDYRLFLGPFSLLSNLDSEMAALDVSGYSVSDIRTRSIQLDRKAEKYFKDMTPMLSSIETNVVLNREAIEKQLIEGPRKRFRHFQDMIAVEIERRESAAEKQQDIMAKLEELKSDALRKIDMIRIGISKLNRDIVDMPTPSSHIVEQAALDTWKRQFSEFIQDVLSTKTKLVQYSDELLDFIEEETTSGLEHSDVMEEIRSLYSKAKQEMFPLETQISTLVDSWNLYFENTSAFLSRNSKISDRIPGAESISDIVALESELDSIAIDIPPPSSHILTPIFSVVTETEEIVFQQNKKRIRQRRDSINEETRQKRKFEVFHDVALQLSHIQSSIDDHCRELESNIKKSLRDLKLMDSHLTDFGDRLSAYQSQVQNLEERAKSGGCYTELDFDSFHEAMDRATKSEVVQLTSRKLVETRDQLAKLKLVLVSLDEWTDLSIHMEKWNRILEMCRGYISDLNVSHPDHEIEECVRDLIEEASGMIDECETILKSLLDAMVFYRETVSRCEVISESYTAAESELLMMTKIVEREVRRFSGIDFSTDLLSEAIQNAQSEIEKSTDALKRRIPLYLQPFLNLKDRMLLDVEECVHLESELRLKIDQCINLRKFVAEWSPILLNWRDCERGLSNYSRDARDISSFVIPQVAVPTINYPPLSNIIQEWIVSTRSRLIELKQKLLREAEAKTSLDISSLDSIDLRVVELERTLPSLRDIYNTSEADNFEWDAAEDDLDTCMRLLAKTWSEIEANSDLVSKRDAVIDRIADVRQQCADRRVHSRFARRMHSISTEIDSISLIEKNGEIRYSELCHELEFVKGRLEAVDVGSDEYGMSYKKDLLDKVNSLLTLSRTKWEKERREQQEREVLQRCDRISHKNERFIALLDSINTAWDTNDTISADEDDIERALSNMSCEIDTSPISLNETMLEELLKTLDSLDADATDTKDLLISTRELRERCIRHNTKVKPLAEDCLKTLRALREVSILCEALKSLSGTNLQSQLHLISTTAEAISALLQDIKTQNAQDSIVPQWVVDLLERKENMLVSTVATPKPNESTNTVERDLELEYQRILEQIEHLNSTFNIRSESVSVETSTLKKYKYARNLLQELVARMEESNEASELRSRVLETLEETKESTAIIRRRLKEKQKERKHEMYQKLFSECKRLVLNLQDAALVNPDRTVEGARLYRRKVTQLKYMIKVYTPSVDRLLSIIHNRTQARQTKGNEAYHSGEESGHASAHTSATHSTKASPETEESGFQRDEESKSDYLYLERIWTDLKREISKMDEPSRIPTRSIARLQVPQPNLAPRKQPSAKSRIPLPVPASINLALEEKGDDPSGRTVYLYPSIHTSAVSVKSIFKSDLDLSDVLDSKLNELSEESEMDIVIKRVEAPQNQFGPQQTTKGRFYRLLDMAGGDRKVYCELRGNQVIVRVGGGWQSIQEYLLTRQFLSIM